MAAGEEERRGATGPFLRTVRAIVGNKTGGAQPPFAVRGVFYQSEILSLRARETYRRLAAPRLSSVLPSHLITRIRTALRGIT